MSAPAFDELLGRLVAANVRFVLIGGLALNAWGVVRGTTEVEIANTKIAVCSLEDLRAMKRAAGRTRDLADLEDLDTVAEQD